MPFDVNQRVGDYEILGLLGAGGMGHVYRARNIISDRIEAMKVLLPDLTADRDLAMRFIAEIRTLASFDHPNIALLHTAFQMDNQLIMVMEYVEGQTLEQRARNSAIPIADVVEYLTQTLSALGYAHARNVVHRDIKPANLMITSHGILKLMDFGIAKSAIDANLTRPGTTIGSLYYMSPEQVRGGTIDARSDLYSTGIVMYELLAGRRPFEAESTFGVLNQQLNTPPQPPIEVNPSLPPQLNAIILKALAKDPAERFQTAEDFRNELKKFSGQAVASPASSPLASPAAFPGIATATSPVFASPAFPPPLTAPVPQPAPQAWAQVPPAASSAPRQAQRPAGTPQPEPPANPRGNRTLWIASGAVAALLALIVVAIAVPHLLKTHAAETPAPLATTQSAIPADPLSSPPPAPPAPPAASSTAPASVAVNQPGNESTTYRAAQVPVAHAVSTSSGPIGTPISAPGKAPGPATLPAEPAGPAAAELDQLQERYIQLDARAQAALKGVAQLRRQQEADGLGLRSDMEAADSRLRSYMQAANQEVHASRAAQAARDMDKAEADIARLEQFLGR